MAWDASFGEWVRDHLSGLGDFEIKTMFGGAGALKGGAMFAILGDDVIWLKADAAMAAEMEAEGSRQFSMDSKTGRRTLPYWSMPEAALDDPDEAVRWAQRSVEIALRPKRRSSQDRARPAAS